MVTYVMARGVRHLWRGNRGSAVVVGRRGIRHVYLSRRGRDREVAHLAWYEIADVAETGTVVSARTASGDVTLAVAGTAKERHDIAESVREHIAATPERPPVVPGIVTFLGDDGATVTEERERRRRLSRWTGGGAALAGADAVACAAATGVDPELWLGTGTFGAAAAVLGFATYRLARFVPRWTARPGAIVLTERPGRPATFTGTRLRLRNESDSDGHVTGRLDAIDGSGARRVVLRSGPDTAWLAETGQWLARHAGIELLDQRRHRPEP